MLLLLIALAAFPWVYSYIEATNHLKRIIANGSQQSLIHKFHRQALVWRAVWIQGFGLLVSLLWLWIFREFPAALYLVWSVYAWAVFGYNFTLVLNRIRSEVFPDYNISPWYQSRQKDAAWTDRTMVRKAAQFGITPEQLAARVYTVCMLVSTAAFVLFSVFRLLFYPHYFAGWLLWFCWGWCG